MPFTSYDYSSGLGALGSGVDAILKTQQDAAKQQKLADLGAKVQAGDWNGALQTAGSYGDPTLVGSVLKLYQDKQNAIAEDAAVGGLVSGAPNAAATPAVAAPQAAQPAAVRVAARPAQPLGALGTGIPSAPAPQSSLGSLGFTPPPAVGSAGPMGQAQPRMAALPPIVEGTTATANDAPPAVPATATVPTSATTSADDSTDDMATAPLPRASSPTLSTSGVPASAADEAKKTTLLAQQKYFTDQLLTPAGKTERGKAYINKRLDQIKSNLDDIEPSTTDVPREDYAKYNIDPNYKGPVQLTDGKLSFPGKPATEVNISQKNETSLDKAAIDDIVDSKKQALGAVGTLKAIDRQTKALDSGAITGAGANWQTNARGMLAKILGIDDVPVTNSQAFDAAATQKGAELAKQIANAGHTTNMDLNVGQTIAGGDRSKTEQAIRQIIDAQAQLAYDKIDEHNQHVQTFGQLNPDNAKKANYFTVKTPEGLSRPIKPASQAPQAGTIMQGYRFKGGDPSQQSNWEKAH